VGALRPNKPKASTQQTERIFAPFKSPFTEEIINTSQGVGGELSQKTITERQSQSSERPPNAEM